MKKVFALAVLTALSLAAPAFAQDAGQPGASGSEGSASGSNIGTSGGMNATKSRHHSMGMGSMHHHHHHHHHHSMHKSMSGNGM